MEKNLFFREKKISDFLSHNIGNFFFRKKSLIFIKKNFFDMKTCFPKILSSFHFCMRKSQTVGWNHRI